MKKPVQTRAERVAIRGSVTDSKRVVRLRMFEDTKNKGWQSDRSYRSSLRSSLHHKLPSKTFTRQNEIDDTKYTIYLYQPNQIARDQEETHHSQNIASNSMERARC
jgi:hypothetical protein